MAKEKSRIVILVLVFVILLMGVFMAYLLLVRPAVTGYAVRAQQQGVEFAILSIMQQAATCQQVPLTFGNQTINLVAIECLQQAQQPAVE